MLRRRGVRASVQAWVVRALLVGVAVATLVGVGAPAHACSCVVGPKGALKSANAVFVARVQPDEPRVIGRTGWPDYLRHQVDVESVYRGRVAARVNVNAMRGMCGSELEPGRRYLIGSYGKHQYRIALCSYARPPSEGALTQARALFGAPYEPVFAPMPDRTDGASDLDPPAEVVWFPGPVWLYPLAGTVLVGGVAWGVWRWRRARS